MFVPAPLGDPRFAILAEAAFGADPGRAAGELPPAADPLGSWYRAVILGGQGRYAAARAQLRALRGQPGEGGLEVDPVLLSLARSTEASLLRQLGWHARAAGYDGRAAALLIPGGEEARDVPGRLARAEAGNATAVGETSGRSESGPGSSPHYVPTRADAVCDALTGLAADALGAGRLALADRLLRRCAAVLADGETSWRPALRWQWVSAENALAAGDAATASRHAAAGLELAESAPSARHLIKSRLLAAAAAAASGDRDRSARLAAEVDAQCAHHALLPLRWACAMLRAGLGVASAAAEAADYGAAIARLGGAFRPLDGG